MLDHALSCAADGYPVFPLHTPTETGCSCRLECGNNRGKHPRTLHGFLDATTDDEKIRRYWGMWPDANIGIPTGETSGICTLDIDPRNGGDSSVAMLGELPVTLGQVTGGGGTHHIYAYPPNLQLSSGTIAAGLDFKARGGYIVAAPSLHASGRRYEWTNQSATPAPIPAALYEKVVNRSRDTKAYENLGSVIYQGQGRHDALLSYGGRIWLDGLSADTLLALLRVLNERQCRPPLPDGELESIASWLVHKGERSRFHADGVSSEVPPERILRFRTASEIAAETQERPEFVVHGYVAVGSVTEFVGKAKAAGKTTFLMHAIRCALDGLSFMGQPTGRTPVVYLTEERPGTFRESLRRAGLLGRDDLHVLYWHETIGHPWDMVIRAAVDECHRNAARMLVVDTVSQFAGLRGDAENNAGDALAALQPLQEAAAAAIGVVAVRHERKGGGDVGESGRGSSAFAGAVDIVVALRRAEGQTRPTVRVLHALSRFDETPDELAVELTPDGYVSLGSAADVAAQEADRALLNHLPRSEDEALCMKHLLELLSNVKRTTGRESMDRLRDAGALARTGAGKKGNPYRYWMPDDGGPASGM